MNLARHLLSLTVLAILLLHASLPIALACGPSYIEPVFKFRNSPDIPFSEFTSGNIGLVRPTFGRKALFIAYRYANGGSFSLRDQQALMDALRGKAPDDNDITQAVEAWVAARKVVVGDEKLPDIYTDKNYSGYNFFPNCTKNAFEVATQVLNERAATHGVENPNVREWLKGQDRVFDICSSGNTYPDEARPDAPVWLKKDRAYQIAAAHFYSLNFDEAVKRFEAIAADDESVWRETADYLIGRTLVRQASLVKDAVANKKIYERAEQHLEGVIRRSGKFGPAAEQLIGLIKYRSRPKERVNELANILMRSGNENIRQDLIDYTWLLDKFEAEVIEQVKEKKAEEERKRAEAAGEKLPQVYLSPEWEAQQKAIQSGQIISVALTYSVPDRPYPSYTKADFKPDATDEEMIRRFEELVGRKLTEEEIGKVMESKANALEERKRYLGANFRFEKESGDFGHQGDPYSDEELSLELIPAFLRRNDLSDWIFAFQTEDAAAYEYSVRRWRETDSPAWLMAAISKAQKDSPDLSRLMQDAEKMNHSAPVFVTVAYHLARLKIEQNKTVEARKLLDEILVSDFAGMPISAQNEFLDLRMRVATSMGEFLKFGLRKPVMFDKDGGYGRLREFMEEEKTWWDEENYEETKEQYMRAVEDRYRPMLPWDEHRMFDEYTADVLNRHFPLEALAQAALSNELPDYIRESLVLTVWARAVILGRRDIATKFALEGAKQPHMSEAFARVVNARTEPARRSEETWLLLKHPGISVFVKRGMLMQGDGDVSSWEDEWWYEPADSEYSHGEEVPKVLLKPPFITAVQSATALKERKQIAALGDAETYLSGRVFEWAGRSPRDPRIPEALFRVAVINFATKYGSGVEELHQKAVELLEKKYADSPWTAKAKAGDF